MKKLIFVLFALMISHSAIAQWVSIGGADGAKEYVDKSRVENYPNSLKSIWHLSDFVEQQSIKATFFKSVVERVLVNCSTKKVQSIAGFFYSENMTFGKVVANEEFSLKDSDWHSVPPNSTGSAMVDIACLKK